jgi:hypothetical protein
VTLTLQPAPAWLISSLKWLNPRRLRAQAIVLAVCLWGVCAVDFTAPGPFDRAGNIKFQDFLPFYISARLVARHRSDQLYDPQVQAAEMQAIIGQSTQVRVPNLYGPQVGLVLAPFARVSFAVAARIWVALSLITYFACVYSVWRCCPGLGANGLLVFIAALAYPPLFHFFVRGQMSVLVLACFTAAFLAFRSGRPFLAGAALGIVIFKPQFLFAIPLIFLLAFAWKPLIGLVVSAAAQLGVAQIYFGTATMRAYLEMLRHPGRWLGAAELSLAPIQMHSLRSFWQLLVPFSTVALALYVLSSVAVLVIAVVVWKSDSPNSIRFSALMLAAVLINPHLFVYDLLVLAPVLLLVTDWSLTNARAAPSPSLLLSSYLVFVLPLFGPISRWTHLQLSVAVFVLTLWLLMQCRTPGHKLASGERRVI